MTRNETELDLQIDLFRLDDEWAEQAQLRNRYGVELADAQKEHNEAKAYLDLVKAEVQLDIRKRPEVYGLAKVTEETVKATVIVDPTSRQALQQMYEAKHRVDILDAAVPGIAHRKKAMAKEVDLFFADYFSRPKATGEESKERMDHVEKRTIRNRGRRKRVG